MDDIKIRVIDSNKLIEAINTGSYEINLSAVMALGAVVAQPASQWTPCSEGLPKDDEEVIVSCTDDSGDTKFSYTTVGWHCKDLWVVNNERNYFVRAWMPLPKPWEGR